MASQELDPIIERFRPNMTVRIVEAVANEDFSTKSGILKAVGSTQTDGGSGLQRINGLIADGVLVPAEASELSNAQTYRIGDESAKIIIEYYKQRILAMEATVSALEQNL